jgi:hypothetical protein
MAATGSKDHF